MKRVGARRPTNGGETVVDAGTDDVTDSCTRSRPGPMSSHATIADCVQLIRSEYLDMPGLQLTNVDAQRLWGLDETTSGVLLDALVQVKFLRRTRDGFYARVNGHSR
jgi:hypothetical protein